MISLLCTMLSVFAVVCLGDISNINPMWVISQCSNQCSGSSDENGCWKECMGPYYGRREVSGLGEMNRQINVQYIINTCSNQCNGSSDEKGCWKECMGPYYGRREI